MWLEHVKVCAEIGFDCMDSDPVKRPMAQHIIEMLDGLEHKHGCFDIDLSTTQVSSFHIALYPHAKNNLIRCKNSLYRNTSNFNLAN